MEFKILSDMLNDDKLIEVSSQVGFPFMQWDDRVEPRLCGVGELMHAERFKCRKDEGRVLTSISTPTSSKLF